MEKTFHYLHILFNIFLGGQDYLMDITFCGSNVFASNVLVSTFAEEGAGVGRLIKLSTYNVFSVLS